MYNNSYMLSMILCSPYRQKATTCHWHDTQLSGDNKCYHRQCHCFPRGTAEHLPPEQWSPHHRAKNSTSNHSHCKIATIVIASVVVVWIIRIDNCCLSRRRLNNYTPFRDNRKQINSQTQSTQLVF